MKKKNFIIALILIGISIPCIIFRLWIFSIILLFISFFFFMKSILYNINILNEECNPDKFFDENKDKKNQYMNCCFALLHGYSKDKKETFKEYLEKAKEKKWKNNLYQMKLDYLELNFHYLNQEVSNEEVEEFNENWANNKYLNILEKNKINKFLSNKHCDCMLTSIVNHFQNAINYYETKNYDISVSEFQYVKKYGGTTFYAKIADEYLTNQLKNIKPAYEIKKDTIHIKDRYNLNKNSIDTYFCLYLILFIIMMNLGGNL